MKNDTYSKKSPEKFKQYAQAFQSPEFKAWIATLTPEQLAEAEAKGLLQPLPENIIGITPLDEEKADERYVHDHSATINALVAHFVSSPRKLRALHALINSKKHRAEILWAAMRYICGDGTNESHAARFGISREAFHSIVKKLRAYLKEHKLV